MAEGHIFAWMMFLVLFYESVLFFFGTDLFEDLVPVSVHQAMSAYDTRKNDIVNTEIMKLRESTQLLNRYVQILTNDDLGLQ